MTESAKKWNLLDWPYWYDWRVFYFEMPGGWAPRTSSQNTADLHAKNQTMWDNTLFYEGYTDHIVFLFNLWLKMDKISSSFDQTRTETSKLNQKSV